MISGTAFSADTATGCRGTTRKDLVSIDASYGLGEAVVGGKVTPDKLYVFQRDDGNEVVIRQMGCKDMKIVYDERGGTREVEVPELEALRWALSLSQAQLVARGVRAVSKAYGGMIMDTEFCIDANDKLWFVQARPETRWNEELERHPHTIFMRRREVDPKAAEQAEVIVEGNGASRGAGHGTVRFLRSALELNKVSKGDVLAAERTDPDMVPGMRVASAIMADVGGDTSHAAITSRELGIAAVIGIQRLDVLRALDGAEVTVDGTRGRVYRGLLPLREVGGELDISKLPVTKTKVGLVLADVGQALFLSRLRDFPRLCSCPVCATSPSLKWACCARNSCWATSAFTRRRWKPLTAANLNMWCRTSCMSWKIACPRSCASRWPPVSSSSISTCANMWARSPVFPLKPRPLRRRIPAPMPRRSCCCTARCANWITRSTSILKSPPAVWKC